MASQNRQDGPSTTVARRHGRSATITRPNGRTAIAALGLLVLSVCLTLGSDSSDEAPTTAPTGEVSDLVRQLAELDRQISDEMALGEKVDEAKLQLLVSKREALASLIEQKNAANGVAPPTPPVVTPPPVLAPPVTNPPPTTNTPTVITGHRTTRKAATQVRPGLRPANEIDPATGQMRTGQEEPVPGENAPAQPSTVRQVRQRTPGARGVTAPGTPAPGQNQPTHPNQPGTPGGAGMENQPGGVQPPAGRLGASGEGDSVKMTDGTDPENIVPASQPASQPADIPPIMIIYKPRGPEDRTYRFSYVDVPWSDVLTDFARMSKLPIEGDVKSVTGNVTFHSPKEFTFQEMLVQLNELLFARVPDKRLLQRKEHYLQLIRPSDATQNIPVSNMFDTFEQMEAAGLDPFDVAIVNMDPPRGWTPFQVIDTFKSLTYDTYFVEANGGRLKLTGLVREHHRFREILDKLAHDGGPPDSDLREWKWIQLQNTKAIDAQNMLKQIFPVQISAMPRQPGRGGPGMDMGASQSEEILIIPDIANNALIVKAMVGKLDQIAEMAAKLDGTQAVGATKMEIVRLENADAVQVERLMKQIINLDMKNKGMNQMQYESVQSRAEQSWDVMADPSTNSMIVMGGEGGVVVAKKLLAQFDVPEIPPENHLVELANQDAQTIVATLTQLYAPTPGKAGGRPPKFVPLTETTVFVSCSSREWGQVEPMMKTLDVPLPHPDLKEHQVKLKVSAPSVVAGILREVSTGLPSPSPGGGVASSGGRRRVRSAVPMPQGMPGAPGGGGGSDQAKFIPDDASGLLLVYCLDEEWEQYDRVIKRIEGEIEEQTPVLKSFELDNARAGDVADTLMSMYGAGPPRPGVGKAPAPDRTFQVWADEPNRTVKVWAAKTLIDEVAPLVEQLDVMSYSGPMTVIKLEYAKALDVEMKLKEAFAAGGGGGRPNVPQNRAVPLPTPSSPSDAVRIVAEPITNTLLVAAPARELKEIMKLVADMDAASEGAVDSRVILTPLYQDVDALADTVRSLFAGGGGAPPPGQPRAQGGAPSERGVLVLVNGDRLILDGPRGKVAEAVKVVNEIDVPLPDPITRKYRVQEPEKTAEKLRVLLAEQKQTQAQVVKAQSRRLAPGRQQPGQPPQLPKQPAEVTEGPVIIYSDDDEGTILVRAVPKDFTIVEELLKVIHDDGRAIGPDTEDDFWVYKCKSKSATDLSWDLDSILNPLAGESSGVQFTTVNDETIMMSGHLTAKLRTKITKLIEIYDVPSGEAAEEGTSYVINTDPDDDELPAPQFGRLLAQEYFRQTGGKAQMVGDFGFGQVDTIDIHADEEMPATRPATMSPCVVPEALLHEMEMTYMQLLAVQERQEAGPATTQPAAAAAEEKPSDVWAEVDQNSNSIRIRNVNEASRKLLEKIEKDLRQLKPATVYRQFLLRNCDVMTASNMLDQILNEGAMAAQQAAKRQMVQPQMPPGQPGEAGQPGRQPGQGARPPMVQAPPPQPARVKIYPDQRTQSLFVRALAVDIPLIVEILKKIDTRTEMDRNVKIFQLVNLDAESLVGNLRDAVSSPERRQLMRQQAAMRFQPGQQGQPGQPMPMPQVQMQQAESEDVQLSAEPQTNCIIARAAPDTLKFIEGIINELEGKTNIKEVEMEIVALKHAKATDLEPHIKQAAESGASAGGGGGGGGGGGRRFGSGQGGGGGGGGGRSAPAKTSVTAYGKTNSLILVGLKQDLQRLKEVIAQLDVDTGEGGGIRQFVLKTPGDVMAKALKPVFPGTKESPITFEPIPGGMVISAPPKEMEQIAEQIAKIEESAVDPNVRYEIKLTIADAETVAEGLQQIFGGGGSRRSSSGRGGFTGAAPSSGGGTGPQITGLAATKTIFVSNCTEEEFKKIKEVAMGMDTVQDPIQVKSYALKHADATEVEAQLTKALAKVVASGSVGNVKLDFISAFSDPRTNSLVVAGGPVTFLVMDRVLAELDVKAGPDVERTTEIHVLPRSTDWQSVSKAITDLYAARSAGGAGKGGAEPPRVAVNPDTSSLVVIGTAKQHEEIKKVIVDPLLSGASGGERVTKVYTVTSADPDTVKSAIAAAFPSAGRAGGDVSVTVDPQTSALIIVARAGDHEKIAEIVKAADEPTQLVKATKFIKIEWADATAVADAMNKTFQAKTMQDKLRRWPVTVTADIKSNTLIITAPTVYLAEAEQMVAAMDVKERADRDLKTFPLKHADATTVAKAIQGAFQPAPGKQASPRDAVSCTPDDVGRSVVVRASPDNMAEIERLIAELDKEDDELRRSEHIITLKNAEAQSVAQGLQQILDASVDKRGGRTPPTIKAIEGTSRLLVWANDPEFETIGNMAKEIDVEDAQTDLPELYQVKNSRASDIEISLNKAFSGKSSGRAPAGAIPLTIVAQETANTIIVRGGKPSERRTVIKLAETLDVPSTTGYGNRILQLPGGRGDVVDLAFTIESQMNESEKARQQQNKEYRPTLVKISADVQTNAILVSSTEIQFEEIRAIVAQLVELGPVGGRVQDVIKSDTISPKDLKSLIEQLQQGKSQGNQRRPGGMRGDALWSRDRRFKAAMGTNESEPRSQTSAEWGRGARVRRTSMAMTLPMMLAQVVSNAAIAQTSQDDERAERRGPKIMQVRSQRADEPKPAAPTTAPAPRAERPGATSLKLDAAGKKQFEAALSGGLDQMTDEARAAASKRLSGSPLNVVETPDGVIVEGNAEDVKFLKELIASLSASIEEKKIEYVGLQKLQANELAKILQDVFKNIQQDVPGKPVRSQDKVEIIADPATSGVFITAVQDKIDQAVALIKKMELIAIGNPGKTFRGFVFKNRRVTEVSEILGKMVKSYLTQKKLDPSQIAVEMDPMTNAVFVTASESDIEFVDTMIKGLDAELPPVEEAKDGKHQIGQADVMIVPLRVAKADALGTLLNELLKKAATGDTPMKDFIRRFRLLDENGNVLSEINLDRPIVIFGEKDSNSLIIASTKDNCLIMKQVAQKFDTEPTRPEVERQVIVLKYADATGLAEQLDKVLKASEALPKSVGGGGAAGGVPEGEAGALVFPTVISADSRTNKLLIVGRPTTVKVLVDLATSMDVPGLDVMPFELVKLKFASPSALEQALTDLMKQRSDLLPLGEGKNADKAEKVVIKSDPRSKSLIIAARASRAQELKELITKLDVPSVALIENIRTITLTKGTATDMATKLKDLWKQQQDNAGGGGGAGGIKLEEPAIVADERSNSLIVAASPGDYDAINSVVQKIENLPLNPMMQVNIVKLNWNSASALAGPLKTLFTERAKLRSTDGKSRPEDEVVIEADENTNSLLVVASRENYEVLLQKVKELDIEMSLPGEVQFFMATNVSAAKVKERVDEIFKEIYRPGVTAGKQADERKKVSVSVDDRTNMLIVSASPENMALVREVFERMNSAEHPWDPAVTRIVELVNTDAVQIAAQVKKHMEEMDKVRGSGGGGAAGGGGASGSHFAVTVFADQRSNRLMIGGTRDGVEEAVKLVTQLDVPANEAIAYSEIYGPLKAASAGALSEMIKKVFDERNKPRGQDQASVPNVAVTIEANAGTNTLLIYASRDDHRLIKDLVDRLDQPSNLKEMVRLFPLENAAADKVKETLDELYQSVGAAPAGGGGGGGGKAVGVVVDERSNSVIVTAPPAELNGIGTLIAQIDSATPLPVREVGIYGLNNEDAEKMSELLNQLLTGQGGGGGGEGGGGGGGAAGSESALVSFKAEEPEGQEVLHKAIRENVWVSFNERTNSVIVTAPPSSLKLIQALIERLDRVKKRPVMVKVFKVTQSDATKIVEILEKMFAQGEGAESQQAFQEGREMNVEGGVGAGGVPEGLEGATEKGTFGRPKTTFTADVRTNSVIAAGWPEDINVVADIIDQLDAYDVQERVSMVIRLTDAKAVDVANAIKTHFDNMKTVLEGAGAETISPQRKMDQEVTVVEHEESNSIIVSAGPRYISQVVSIVEQLDIPPPQVMIQVMIAEVTLDDRFEMGLEFALQELKFSETAVPGGNGILQSSHFDVTGGTDLGAAGSGLGGFSFTITGEDFGFLVRALQSDSRLEVIQSPMIMCQDNQEANISVGQSVPIPSAGVAVAGQFQTNVTYQDVGTMLKVKPHINPDGWVYLEVAPEISSVSGSNVSLGGGAFAPILSSRKAETVVAVRDGETVVIGGLITTEESDAESKVPFLGDIPGVGAMFRTTTKSKRRTELLLALTPRVARTVEDGRRLSIEMRDESGIITPNMKRSPLFRGIRIKPEDEMPWTEELPMSTEEGQVEQLNYPTDDPSAQPVTQPKVEPAPLPEKPLYGPPTPRYGPEVANEEDVLTRRDARPRFGPAMPNR